MRTFLGVFSLLVMLAFLLLSGTLAFWPAHLAALHLSRADAKLVIMQVISLLLLLAYLHRHLSRGWRLFTLAGSFLVLSESILMSELFVK